MMLGTWVVRVGGSWIVNLVVSLVARTRRVRIRVVAGKPGAAHSLRWWLLDKMMVLVSYRNR